MSVARLHPEELLDRAAAGALSKIEAAQLDAHLAQCSACRLELRAREDFQSVPTPTVDTDALIRAAFAMAPRPIVARRRILPRYAAAASILLALVVGGAAMASPFGRELIARVTAARPTVEAPPPAPAPRARPKFIVTETLPPDPLPPPRPAPASEVHVSPPEVPAAAPQPEEHEPTAADLFDRAAALRRSGDHLAAAGAYRDLLDRHPRSAEATQALVALGRLMLDERQAAEALVLFDRYLALGALPLEEEALSLRARTLGDLGKSSEELRAWQRLLERFPDSVHKDRATDRLNRLEKR